MQLKIINNNETYSHVALSGNLDCEGVAEIFEEFRHSVTDRGLSVIVDLTEVGFISSLGIRTLVANAEELSRKNALLVLYNPQPFVEEELQAAGLEKTFSVTNDLGNALALVSGKE